MKLFRKHEPGRIEFDERTGTVSDPRSRAECIRDCSLERAVLARLGG
jgi:hypothetical protein